MKCVGERELERARELEREGGAEGWQVWLWGLHANVALLFVSVIFVFVPAGFGLCVCMHFCVRTDMCFS